MAKAAQKERAKRAAQALQWTLGGLSVVNVVYAFVVLYWQGQWSSIYYVVMSLLTVAAHVLGGYWVVEGYSDGAEKIVGYDVIAVALLAQVTAAFHWAGFVFLLLLPAMAAYYGWEFVSTLLRMFGPQLTGAAAAAGASRPSAAADGGRGGGGGGGDDEDGEEGGGRRKLTGSQRRALNRQRVG